jgi:hypothetical protein
MIVREFIEKLQQLDPELEVVVEGPDHSYRRITRMADCEAELFQGRLFEFFDMDSLFDLKKSKVVDVVVLL